ncbi:hypothetical protein ASF11_10020 [Acidovorax sp. Leaf76]|nr:hypothetical protein ASF11_10020 [Acidovorax sp. Leaf76]KQS32128.1 hypothetical protein ASG27_09140 [Acidovorax sp. Leaf191]
MNSGGDRLLATMGPARLSHPEQYGTIMDDLANKGVDVRFTEGQFAYGPSATRGVPGNLVLDPDASMSALRHEYGHFLDDQALGFPGQRFYYESPDFRLASEPSQYLGEIRTARQLGDDAARAQLIRDYLGEKSYLIDRYYFTQDGKPIPYGTLR